MKYFLVENREANYRNWYRAESIWDAQCVAMHDSQLLAMDVTECDLESIPSDAVIYPASKRDVEYANSRKAYTQTSVEEIANLFKEKIKEKEE